MKFSACGMWVDQMHKSQSYDHLVPGEGGRWWWVVGRGSGRLSRAAERRRNNAMLDCCELQAMPERPACPACRTYMSGRGALRRLLYADEPRPVRGARGSGRVACAIQRCGNGSRCNCDGAETQPVCAAARPRRVTVLTVVVERLGSGCRHRAGSLVHRLRSHGGTRGAGCHD